MEIRTDDCFFLGSHILLAELDFVPILSIGEVQEGIAFQSLCGASYDEITVAKKKNQILVNGSQGHNSEVLIERV